MKSFKIVSPDLTKLSKRYELLSTLLVITGLERTGASPMEMRIEISALVMHR
jgi:hypothetical protein